MTSEMLTGVADACIHRCSKRGGADGRQGDAFSARKLAHDSLGFMAAMIIKPPKSRHAYARRD